MGQPKRVCSCLAKEIRQMADWALGSAELIPNDPILYDSTCECYSDYTTCPANITIPLRTHRANPPIANIEYLLECVKSLQRNVRWYLKKTDPWKGCESCKGDLTVDVRLYPDDKA